MGKSGRTIQAVERTFEILEVLRQNGSRTVSEIAAEVGLSQGTVHHHLTTLFDAGYVTKGDAEYRLSKRFLVLGGPARDRDSLFRNGREHIDRLASETGETARLVVEQFGYSVTIYQAHGDEVEHPYGGLGHQEPLHTTAAGKVILAYASDDRFEAYLEQHGLSSRTSSTITDHERLEAELKTARADGLAYADEEHAEGRRCMTIPVFQNDDNLLGAISLCAPTDRKSQSWFESEAEERLRHTADTIKTVSTYSSWIE